MKIPFTKMHGAGNDFILVDDRDRTFPSADVSFLTQIMSRRTGIGCDGILLIQPSEAADFRMRFINPDGGEQDMCGNGARCIAKLANRMGIAPKNMHIETGAGTIRAEVSGDRVRLELTEPVDMQLNVETELEFAVDFVNTGVPHAVAWVEDVAAVDIQQTGSALRNHALFLPEGANANFAQIEGDGSLRVRTYERGVEAETLACGTGATAVALVAAEREWVNLPVAVHCAGGFDLVIDSICGTGTLTGGAETVFEGVIDYGNRV